jgi:hypothetical protein
MGELKLHRRITVISDKITVGISILLILTLLTSGCTDLPPMPEISTKTALDLISPVVVLQGSEQYCIQYPDKCPNQTAIPTPTTIPTTAPPTPIPTVTVEPTSKYFYVDPYAGGERFEGQWFQWTWLNASGYKDANRGIVIYGHSYHSRFTQWNGANGNFQLVSPKPGYRFLAVYVHEEDFGPDDSALWGYDETYFFLQYNGVLHEGYTGYSQNLSITELEYEKWDYYRFSNIKPFGIYRVYRGFAAAATGGYVVKYNSELRTGQGNSWDGYIIYEIPVSITDNDIYIIGKFDGKGVNWRFDSDIKIYPIQSNIVRPPTAVPTKPPMSPADIARELAFQRALRNTTTRS